MQFQKQTIISLLCVQTHYNVLLCWCIFYAALLCHLLYCVYPTLLCLHLHCCKENFFCMCCCSIPFISSTKLHAAAFSYSLLSIPITIDCHPWVFICCCVASAICTVAAFCFIILLCAHTLTLYSPLLAHREKSSSRCFALHSPHKKKKINTGCYLFFLHPCFTQS